MELVFVLAPPKARSRAGVCETRDLLSGMKVAALTSQASGLASWRCCVSLIARAASLVAGGYVFVTVEI